MKRKKDLYEERNANPLKTYSFSSYTLSNVSFSMANTTALHRNCCVEIGQSVRVESSPKSFESSKGEVECSQSLYAT